MRANQCSKKHDSSGTHVYCKKCNDFLRELRVKRINAFNRKWRKLGWILATLGLVVVLSIVITLAVVFPSHLKVTLILGILSAIATFAFIYCLCAHNNFISDLWLEIFDWGFVRMPGLIFELSLDGIVWLLTVKLFFWILQIALSLAATILATIIGGICSIFVFPFAAKWAYKNPERTNID